MRHWQITQGSPSPAWISHWTGITLPRRPRREPERWIRHSLSLGWQLPGWHQWVLEEAEPVGGVFLERAACTGESSHALQRRCFSERHISGRWQRQTSSLLLPEHVWVCLLERGYKRAAAISGWFLSGHIGQIRLPEVKKSKFAEKNGGFLYVETSILWSSQLEDMPWIYLQIGFNPGSQWYY